MVKVEILGEGGFRQVVRTTIEGAKLIVEIAKAGGFSVTVTTI